MYSSTPLAIASNLNFWSGKRVFLTGHTGFKGSWLSLWLQSLGADVHGFALEPLTTQNLFAVARVKENMASHTICDIRDFPALKKSMQASQADIVIHMAAQPLVRQSYSEPVETYAINVMGTVHLLEAARHTSSVKAIVVVSSDKCYENKEWLWGYREDEPMGGYDPYSNSKGCAELVTSAYRCSFFEEKGIALASARAGNVIGGGDWAVDRLVPDIIRALDQNLPMLIRNPNAIRPWQHVLEPLRGYLTLAERLYTQGTEYAEAWNFGPIENDVKPVQWIVERINEIWGKNINWKIDVNEHPHEAKYLKLDCSKSKVRLDWQPRWHLDDALDAIVKWQKAYMDHKEMKQVTLNQIKQYEQAQIQVECENNK